MKPSSLVAAMQEGEILMKIITTSATPASLYMFYVTGHNQYYPSYTS